LSSGASDIGVAVSGITQSVENKTNEMLACLTTFLLKETIVALDSGLLEFINGSGTVQNVGYFCK